MRISGRKVSLGPSSEANNFNAPIHDITVTLQELEDLYHQQNGRCYWFNLLIDPDSVFVPNNPLAMSADRIDNSIGYIKENLVICCRFANLARGPLSVEEFEVVTKLVGLHYDEDAVRLVRESRNVLIEPSSLEEWL
jgi:hypothetical protein